MRRGPALAALAAALLAATTAPAQDLREAWRQADADRQAADERAAAVEARILNDRNLLTAAVDSLEQRQGALEGRVADLDRHLAEGEKLLEDLEEQWAASELDFKEISGNVRLAARDLETLLHESYFSALLPERLDRVGRLLDTGYFPDIDDITGMADVMFQEMRLSGQVSRHETVYTGRDGRETTGEVFTLGRFTAAYRAPQETGFLTYNPEGGRLVALAKLPGGGIGRALDSYLAGEGANAPLDLSGGAALAQVTHAVTLTEQIRAGGPIVWPILGIAALALLIIVTRAFFLQRIHQNTDRVMTRVNELAEEGDWQACDELVAGHDGGRSPVIAVVRAGLAVRHQDREVQESVLQEAILHQLPRVERGLSVLAVLAAVAPLLGLLGTVSGMINTFRVITLFGTGDPKLMSGGISEALITTELGLAVAIPIMLAHTFLSRRSDHIVGDMEEKAVQLTNIIQTRRSARAASAAAGGAA